MALSLFFFSAVCFKFIIGIYLHVLAHRRNPYLSFLEKHAGINKFQIELENSYDYPYSKYKKKITCMALFGRFPRPAIKGSCLDLLRETEFLVSNYRTFTCPKLSSYVRDCRARSCPLVRFHLDLGAIEQFVVVGRLVENF